MARNWFVVRALATLFIIGLLIVGGLAIHRIGWSQGYRVGQLAVGGEGGAVVPYAPYGPGFFGLLPAVGLLLLLLIVVSKLFRLWAWSMIGGPWMIPGPHWKMTTGPKGERRTWHWHRRHAPVPPWCWDWEEPTEEAERDAETDAAEA